MDQYIQILEKQNEQLLESLQVAHKENDRIRNILHMLGENCTWVTYGGTRYTFDGEARPWIQIKRYINEELVFSYGIDYSDSIFVCECNTFDGWYLKLMYTIRTDILNAFFIDLHNDNGDYSLKIEDFRNGFSKTFKSPHIGRFKRLKQFIFGY